MLANDDFLPDTSFDDPTEIIKNDGAPTEALWNIMNDKLYNAKAPSIRFVNSIVLEVEVGDVPKEKNFNLNLFLRPQIPIVSVL